MSEQKQFILNKHLFKKGLILAVIFALIDQAHKYYMLEILNIDEGEPLNIFPFFDLVMVWNKGVSFGMFNHGQTYEHQAMLLAAFAIGIIVLLMYWLAKANNKFQMYAIALVIGGAAGNVVDRFLHGAVADFFDFYIGTKHWPAFNIADSFICVGVFLLVFESLFVKNKAS